MFKEIDYQWRTSDSRHFLDFFRKERFNSMRMAVHPNLSERILIIYPGLRSSIDGTFGKYKKLAPIVQQSGLAAVVRLESGTYSHRPWLTNLDQGVKYALAHAQEICGSPTPELFLMGSSCGATVVAALAFRYPSVSRILLIAPSLDDDTEVKLVKNGLKKFMGEIYTAVGDDDEVVGRNSGLRCLNLAPRARRKESIIILGCGHGLSGHKNSRILSQLPFWAFGPAGKQTLPAPDGGIELY